MFHVNLRLPGYLLLGLVVLLLPLLAQANVWMGNLRIHDNRRAVPATMAQPSILSTRTPTRH